MEKRTVNAIGYGAALTTAAVFVNIIAAAFFKSRFPHVNTDGISITLGIIGMILSGLLAAYVIAKIAYIADYSVRLKAANPAGTTTLVTPAMEPFSMITVSDGVKFWRAIILFLIANLCIISNLFGPWVLAATILGTTLPSVIAYLVSLNTGNKLAAESGVNAVANAANPPATPTVAAATTTQPRSYGLAIGIIIFVILLGIATYFLFTSMPDGGIQSNNPNGSGLVAPADTSNGNQASTPAATNSSNTATTTASPNATAIANAFAKQNVTVITETVSIPANLNQARISKGEPQ